MSREVNVVCSLQVNKGNLSYQSNPPNFTADMAGAKGPTPGAITVSVEGTDVNLSQLTTPGWCRLWNLDATNFVTYGIWDPEAELFYPFGELEPGKGAVLKLSRFLFQEYGTGAGTEGPDTNQFRMRANSAACNVVVEAFEA